mmetsp:Transcript_526/g.1463  ORF Transcript_526/g.1463 Transcript_526/m.1463 type:complete len:177 (-) Transcript_526:548-1078(-)
MAIRTLFGLCNEKAEERKTLKEQTLRQALWKGLLLFSAVHLVIAFEAVDSPFGIPPQWGGLVRLSSVILPPVFFWCTYFGTIRKHPEGTWIYDKQTVRWVTWKAFLSFSAIYVLTGLFIVYGLIELSSRQYLLLKFTFLFWPTLMALGLYFRVLGKAINAQEIQKGRVTPTFLPFC